MQVAGVTERMGGGQWPVRLREPCRRTWPPNRSLPERSNDVEMRRGRASNSSALNALEGKTSTARTPTAGQISRQGRADRFLGHLVRLMPG